MAFNKARALERAEKYAAKRQHDRAIKEYAAVVEHDPSDVRARLLLADSLVRCGRREDAVTQYEAVAAHYARQKDWQKLQAVCRQVLNLDPKRAGALEAMGKALVKLGRGVDGAAAFEAAAAVANEEGRADDVLRLLALAADADPTSVARRVRLAEAHSRAGNKAEAVAAFRVAAKLLEEADRPRDLVRVVERLLYHDPRDLDALRTCARTYLRLDDPRSALMKLNTLLQADPKDVAGLELLAEVFVALGKKDKAVSVLHELARTLVESDDADHRTALERIVRRGLTWAPDHTGLAELVRIAGIDVDADADVIVEADDVEEIEEIEDFEEIEEIEDFEEIEEVEAVEAEGTAAEAGAGVTEESVPPMTRTVLEEATGPQAAAAEQVEGVDVEQVLYEARVYLKYKLFEHASEHLEAIFEHDPEHAEAWSLRARALRELGRDAEAATAYVRAARSVLRRDPALAREHVEAALALDAGHAQARALQEELAAPSAPHAPAPTLEADDEASFAELAAEAQDAGEQEAAAEFGEVEIALPLDDAGSEIAIEVTEADAVDEEAATEPVVVEDRFGLSDAGPLPEAEEGAEAGAAEGAPQSEAGEGTAAEGEGEPVDLSEEIAEIRFYAAQGLDEDVEAALADLERRYPDHPEVRALRESLAPSPPPPAAAAEPLDLSDEDAYLAEIFAEPSTSPRRDRAAVAGAQLEEADPRTCFDLGTAYRDMGLADQAIEQFDLAARDDEWRARALVMKGLVLADREQLDEAADVFRAAAEAARDDAERNEAHYELAVVLERAGRRDEARAALEAVGSGYRDRDEKLAALAGEG